VRQNEKEHNHQTPTIKRTSKNPPPISRHYSKSMEQSKLPKKTTILPRTNRRLQQDRENRLQRIQTGNRFCNSPTNMSQKHRNLAFILLTPPQKTERRTTKLVQTKTTKLPQRRGEEKTLNHPPERPIQD